MQCTIAGDHTSGVKAPVAHPGLPLQHHVMEYHVTSTERQHATGNHHPAISYLVTPAMYTAALQRAVFRQWLMILVDHMSHTNMIAQLTMCSAATHSTNLATQFAHSWDSQKKMLQTC
jgi:hypothetical protein